MEIPRASQPARHGVTRTEWKKDKKANVDEEERVNISYKSQHEMNIRPRTHN